MKKILFAAIVAVAWTACSGPGKNAGSPWGDDKRIAQRVDSVLSLMTLEEKIGQMNLLTSDWDVTGPSMRTDYIDLIKSGRVGNIFNAYTAEYTRSLQKIAVEQTRLGIPLLFGYDVIHGHRTIFPISLGEAASWDIESIRGAAAVAAAEASASGIHWTFAPMVDICFDPRWGRVSEGAGEDTYLGSRIAEARVRGFQGSDLADASTVLACVKHYAAYGAAQAGRDYNTVDMSDRVLRDVYLPPYKAAVDAGAATVMTSFNEVDGVPATANSYLLDQILRKEWGFKGFVVTDYTSINEMVAHGYALDLEDAARLAVNAGVDMDLQGSVYDQFLAGLVGQGKVSEKQIDKAVRDILAMKFRLGLFDDPYRYCDAAREAEEILSPENRDAARDMARKSFVLLKNDAQTLPLARNARIALVGALADSKADMLGSWYAAGRAEDVVTIREGMATRFPNMVYTRGCNINDGDRSGFAAAVAAARGADVVVFVMGEAGNMSGEAASRSDIGVPGVQTELLAALEQTGKPVVALLANGRPLTLERESALSDAILEIWFPGTEAGRAVADVLAGDYNPSGKLPVTFPRNIGQVPLHYNQKNTGRPIKDNEKYTSRYLDVPNTPLYAFGHGLSYTRFDYSDLQLGSPELTRDGKLEISVQVTNSGAFDGTEIVQLYVRDMVGSVTRPVKELKGFSKVFLPRGAKQTVTFTLTPDDLAFTRADNTFGNEPGEYTLFVGGSSDNVLETKFILK